MDNIAQALKYTIQDDFMFGTVMRDADICKEFLEIILNLKIWKIEYPEGQKTIDLSKDAKSVRLDVYVEDDANTIYDVEMQTTSNRNLPKRSRYYQGMIDLDHLRKGMDYTQLKKSLVIFVCPFDPYQKGEYIYRFRNVCRLSDGEEFEFGDETEKIFVNATGTKGAVNTKFKRLMEYIMDDAANDSFTEKLDNQVLRINNNEDWRLERMTLEMKLREMKQEGQQEGERNQAAKTILSMLADGEPMEKICRYTGLSAEQVRFIAKQKGLPVL